MTNNKYLAALFLAIRLFVYQYVLFILYVNPTPVMAPGIAQCLSSYQMIWYPLCIILPIMVLTFPSLYKHRRVWELLFVIGICIFLHYECVKMGITPPLQRWREMFNHFLTDDRRVRVFEPK